VPNRARRSCVVPENTCKFRLRDRSVRSVSSRTGAARLRVSYENQPSVLRMDASDRVYLGRVRRSEQLLNRTEQGANLRSCSSTLRARSLCVAKDFTELHESADDSDIDLGGAVAAQNAGKHGHALFRECIRRRASAARPYG
jgi:hypothetical protein